MKPAVCCICGKNSDNAGDGDWVEFSDYDAAGEKSLSHPDGLEYFCEEHKNIARCLDDLSFAQALQVIKRLTAIS